MKVLRVIAGIVALAFLVVAGGAAYLVATFDAARIKQEIATAVEKQTGRVLKFEGDLALAFWPNVAVRLGRTTLSEPGGKAEFARLEAANMTVAVMPLLSQQIVVREVVLDGLALTVVKRKDGSLSIADLLGTPQEEKVGTGTTAPALDIATVRIGNARFDWRDEQKDSHYSLADLNLTSGTVRFTDGNGSIETLALAARGQLDADTFTLNLEVPRLDMVSAGARGALVKLAATLDGKDRNIAVTLTLANVAGNAQSLQIDKFALEAEAKMSNAHVVAHLASPVALDLGKQTVALPQLAGLLDLAHPGLPMKSLALPLAGTASADLARQSARLQFDTRLDTSTIRAKVDVGKFAPLALAFDLDIDQLDLDKYLPFALKGGGIAGAGRGKSGTAPGFSAIKGLDLAGTVRIGRLTAAKLKADNVRIRFDAKDGRIEVSPQAANLFGDLPTGADVKAKVEEKKEAFRQKVDDKLKGGLKGLFK